MAECWATMVSRAIPGHTHLCESDHTDGDHMCLECGRRFWTS